MDFNTTDFKLGQEVHAIVFSDGRTITAGTHICDRIAVSMENGQMAGVPWFDVWKEGRVVSKWNGALVEGVLFE